MAERIRTKKTSKKEDAVVEELPKTDVESTEDLKAAVDELLDEIDGLLETNAEEFVRNYVQKGGQ